MDFHPDQQSSAPKTSAKIDWKILGGLIVVVIFVAYILVRFFVFVSGSSVNAHEKTLSDYYAASAKRDTNAVKTLVAPDFTDEASGMMLVSGRYEVFSYSFERAEIGPKKGNAVSNGRPMTDMEKILFSVTTLENSRRVSYLLEAYFVPENSQPKLKFIRKLSAGKNITK